MSVADDPIWSGIDAPNVRPFKRRRTPDAEPETTNNVAERAEKIGHARRKNDIDPILCAAGAIDMLASVGEDALIRADAPIFQRGDMLVRPCRRELPGDRGQTVIAAGVAEVKAAAMIDELNRAVEWQKFDQRCKSWVVCDPPPKVADTILSRSGQWRLRSIAGVISTPTIRPDGSLLTDPGYDKATRLYHVADASLVLPLQIPSLESAQKGLAELIGLLSGFPFLSDVDRSVALSALLTPVCRGAMSVAPLHAFRAPTPGSGKSYISDLASMIATGRRCPVVPPAPKEEEAEKRLAAMLLGGYPIISLDNVNGELGGDLLCQAIERPLLRLRVFGELTIQEVENRACVFANGNGLRIRGDMTRRTIMADLDSQVERPEQRQFDFDPVAVVEADRARYVAACLTIVRSYLMVGSDTVVSPLASFKDWSRTVRGALIWLGQPDPCKSMETARESDPELEDLRRLMHAWTETVGIKREIAASTVCKMACENLKTDCGVVPDEWEYPALREAILSVASVKYAPSPIALGKWLRSNSGRICEKKRFIRGKEDRNGVLQWKLDNV